MFQEKEETPNSQLTTNNYQLPTTELPTTELPTDNFLFQEKEETRNKKTTRRQLTRDKGPGFVSQLTTNN